MCNTFVRKATRVGEEDMTIIVWDGETLATDRQANDGHEKWESEKAWYVTHKNKENETKSYNDVLEFNEL